MNEIKTYPIHQNYQSAPKRGEVYYVKSLSGAQSSRNADIPLKNGRPCVIVSRDIENLRATIVQVCFITRNGGNPEMYKYPTTVTITDSSPHILHGSYVKCSQVYSVNKEDLAECAGFLCDEDIKKVDRALMNSLDLTRYVEELEKDGTEVKSINKPVETTSKDYNELLRMYNAKVAECVKLEGKIEVYKEVLLARGN